MKALISRLMRDERAASAVEYGMICSLIVLGAFLALKGVANESSNLWGTINQKSSAAVAAANAG